MKVKCGINPDYADTDEIDIDALDALSDYRGGSISFEELKNLVGTDAAQAVRQRLHPDEDDNLYNPDSFFDDPDSFL